MAFVLSCRAALRRNAVPVGLTLSAAGLLMHRQHRHSPLRLDALPATSTPAASEQRSELHDGAGSRLDPAVIKQLSGGSIAGLCLGVLVSVFSRTLVLLIGVGIVAVQVAARYGIDVVGSLKIRKRTSRILTALYENPALKLSFGATFALSAFMHF